jgi:chromosome segregation ATPase
VLTHIPSDGEILRTIARKMTSIEMRLDDTLVAVHRLESEVGAIRGRLSAMSGEYSAVLERQRDLEMRIRDLEMLEAERQAGRVEEPECAS